MMEITYTKHARLRMAQRRISESEVGQAISNADIQYTDPAGNDIFVAHVGNRRIKVVVAKGSNPPHVITTGD